MASQEKIEKLMREMEALDLSEFRFPDSPVFAGSFFVPNPKKPAVKIVIHDDNPDDIASAIVSSNSNSLVDVDTVNYMIYKELEQITATLPEDWTSFGVEIGKKGDIITPLSLLEVNISDGAAKPKAKLPLKTHSCTGRLAMYYIFAPITLDTIYEGQRNALAAKMAAAIPYGQKIRSVSHQNIAKFYGSLRANYTYQRMAGALDMFMERFPDHAAYKMRVGTECTRFQRCNANLLIPHFATLMDISDRNQLLKWIWHTGAAREAERLMDPRNALDDPYSYAPYFSCMQLGENSIASIKNNTELQVFVHTLGAILGNERSKKAKMFNNCSNAPMIASFVVGAIKSAHRQLGGQQTSPEMDMDDIMKNAGKCPLDLDSKSWYIYLRGNQGLEKAYLKRGARMALGLTNLGRGTIGEACVAEAKHLHNINFDVPNIFQYNV